MPRMMPIIQMSRERWKWQLPSRTRSAPVILPPTAEPRAAAGGKLPRGGWAERGRSGTGGQPGRSVGSAGAGHAAAPVSRADGAVRHVTALPSGAGRQ